MMVQNLWYHNFPEQVVNIYDKCLPHYCPKVSICCYRDVPELFGRDCQGQSHKWFCANSSANTDRLLLLLFVIAPDTPHTSLSYRQVAPAIHKDLESLRNLLRISRNQADLDFLPILSLLEKNSLIQKNSTRFGPKISQQPNSLTFDFTI